MNAKKGSEQLLAENAELRRQLDELTRRHEEEEKFRWYIEKSPDAITIVDDRGWHIEVNPAACALFGYSRGEFMQLKISDLAVNKETVHFRKLLRTGTSYGETAMIKKDGTVVHVEIHAVKLDEHRYIGVHRDITKRKQTEEALRNSEERYRTIFSNSPLGISHFDRNGVLTDCNDKVIEILGTTRDRLLGFNMLSNLRDPVMKEQFKKALAGGIGSYDSYYTAVTGTTITPLKAKFNPIASDEGDVLGVVGVFEDVTDQRNAEEKIGFQANLLEQVCNAIIAMDLDGKVIYWNKYSEVLFQWGAHEAIGKDIAELVVPPSELDNARKTRQTVMENGYWEGEIAEKRKDGSTFIMHLVVTLIKNAEGLPTGMVGVGTDITERKVLEDKMARLDRLNMVGEMAAGIGHEVRNPLTTVRGFLQLMAQKERYNEDRKFMDLMINEIDRASSIISEYLSLAKNKMIELKPARIEEIVRNVVPLLQADAMVSDKFIKVQIDETPCLYLDKKEISQLIINLVRNGIEAINEGEFVTVRTFVDGNEVVLSVSDSGPGVAPEVLRNIGTPFVTTKENGTGLGLPVCFSIAARHNASISVDTDKTGTTFNVRFKQ